MFGGFPTRKRCIDCRNYYYTYCLICDLKKSILKSSKDKTMATYTRDIESSCENCGYRKLKPCPPVCIECGCVLDIVIDHKCHLAKSDEIQEPWYKPGDILVSKENGIKTGVCHNNTGFRLEPDAWASEIRYKEFKYFLERKEEGFSLDSPLLKQEDYNIIPANQAWVVPGKKYRLSDHPTAPYDEEFYFIPRQYNFHKSLWIGEENDGSTSEYGLHLSTKEEGCWEEYTEPKKEKLKADKNENFYTIELCIMIPKMDDSCLIAEKFTWEYSNKKQAEEATRRVKETLMKYHEEIGE